jgi:hypothetical protein
MELNYECAGICDPLDYYVFTDINRGIPKRSCNKAIVDQLIKTAHMVSFMAALITLFSIISIYSMWVLHSRYPDDLYKEDPYQFYSNLDSSSEVSNKKTSPAFS